LFSDIPNDTLVRWDELTGTASILRHNAGHPDGSTRDRQGRLITCELGSRTLTRTEHDGTVTVLADTFEGTRLTGPNDVIVKSDGTIWFSDNGAGIRGNYMGDKAPKEMPYRVYTFSPDESKLYVVDTPDGPRTTHVYDMEGGKAVNGRLFFDATPGFADGIRVDTEGNVWAGFSGGDGHDGVAVFAPDGTLIGRILLPERCANLCFGGPKRNRLFMTASQSVYALYVEAQGVAGG
ncbi:MAG: SMP-30/gluconolactonase/LRE family protein, partial [Alphaproteobacteria bacterium]